ncbi:MAG: XRE family transcriptional regulator [Pirellulales bacterium]
MTQRIEASANPAVLSWARRTSGLEVEDAARKAQVKSERVAAWESGNSRPTINQLRRLADIYRRPLAVFFLAVPPPEESLPSDYRRFTREAMPRVSPELRAAIRLAQVRRQATLELYEDLGEEPPRLTLAAHVGEAPEEVGARLRGALAPDIETPDARSVLRAWRTAAEDAGVLVFQADRIDVDEMRGFSISDRPLPAIVLNMQDAPQARTFTLLHEMTHVLLGAAGLCTLEELGPNTPVKRVEVFCNHVAGAALVPADSLLAEPEVPKKSAGEIADVALTALARRFGVSPEVITRRLVTLGRVTAAFYQRKRVEFQRQYRELRHKQRAGFAPPAVLAVARNGRSFTRRALEAFDEDRITASDIADLLGIRLKHLDRVRIAVQAPSGSDEDAN